MLDGGIVTDKLSESGLTNFELSNSSAVGRGTDLLWSIEQALLTSAATGSVIDAHDFTGATTLKGGLGNDSLGGGIGIDSIVGGAGNDTVTGGLGDDNLQGGLDSGTSDLLFEQVSGVSSLSATALTGAGNDKLSGFDRFSLTGGPDNDAISAMAMTLPVTLNDGDGDDKLTGGGGADDLFGGIGQDSIVGGGGNDMLFGNGGDGFDQLRESGNVNATLATRTLTGFGTTDTFTGIDAAVLTGGPGANVLTVTTIVGSVTLNDAAGNDTLIGGSGDDSLDGEDGNDTLSGDGGTDLLFGGAGTDSPSSVAAPDSIDPDEDFSDPAFFDLLNDLLLP